MEHEVKLTAGIGSTEDFETLALAGVDEIFCGYVPLEWNLKFGNLLPANRREVLFYHVQIGTLEEMKILAKKASVYKINVAVTFNALYYSSEQLKMLGKMMQDLLAIGVENFIVADIGLMLYLREKKIPCKVHISGELGEVNTGTMKMLHDICSEKEGPQITRWIFHRKQSLAEIAKCISYGKSIDPDLEYEAFFLNEKCHFAGGFCNSLHCDEMVHLCQMPYELVRLDGSSEDAIIKKWNDVQDNKVYYEVTGESGCGMCALWEMRKIGVTHLKIVGRGKSVVCMTEDVKAVKTACNIMRHSLSESEYVKKMRQNLFLSNCSGNCYYQ